MWNKVRNDFVFVLEIHSCLIIIYITRKTNCIEFVGHFTSLNIILIKKTDFCVA